MLNIAPNFLYFSDLSNKTDISDNPSQNNAAINNRNIAKKVNPAKPLPLPEVSCGLITITAATINTNMSTINKGNEPINAICQLFICIFN